MIIRSPNVSRPPRTQSRILWLGSLIFGVENSIETNPLESTKSPVDSDPPEGGL